MIYIVAHKPVDLPAMEGYRPIQVGAAPERFPGYLRDDVGDSISQKNASYCELTALYWIWKNTDDAIKGLVHYRRFFGRHPLSGWLRGVYSAGELAGFLNNCDLIVPRLATFHVDARRELCLRSCTEPTFDALRETTAALYPDYTEDFDAFFAGNRASLFNMLVARREVFDAYCAWLFPLLFALEPRVDLANADAYQRRVFGFLAERLLNVWIRRNSLRTKPLAVVHTEAAPAERFRMLRRNATNSIRYRLSGAAEAARRARG